MTTPQPTPERPRLIAHEEASRRFILGIGSQRIAFDCSVRATKLPPHTGDEPAPVLPLPKKKKSTSDPRVLGVCSPPKCIVLSLVSPKSAVLADILQF